MITRPLIISELLVAALLCGGCRPAPETTPQPPPPTEVTVHESYFSEIPIEFHPAGSHAGVARVGTTADRYFMPDIMGPGGALLDFDGDGALDMLLISGHWAGGGDQSRMGLQLLRQTPDGQFQDCSQAAGLGEFQGYGIGVAVADIDNDGDRDFYVTGFGGDRLWINQGDGTFVERTTWMDSLNRRWGTAASFCDFDRDGALDLCVVTYLDYFPGSRCDDGSGRPDYCGPKSFSGTVTRLFRNLGGVDARGFLFHDMTVQGGFPAAPGPGLGLYTHDFDGDGRTDLFVANDMSPNALWIQQTDGSFREEAAIRGVAGDRFGIAPASMGVVCNDLNGDGTADLFITTLRGETNLLLLGRGGGLFSDETASSGLGPLSLEYTGFGTVAFDLENDGDLDLAVVNGRVKRAPPLSTARLDPFWNDYAEPSQLFLNDAHGHFIEASASGGAFTQRVDVARGLILGDIDNDGDYDLLVTYSTRQARLFRNDWPRTGHWLMVRTRDSHGNREGYGAQVEVEIGTRRFIRHVNPSSSYLSSHDVRVHFGLAEATSYDRLTVRWADGPVEDFVGGPADRELVIERGRGTLRPETATP
ncbi:MAG: CRTAC1 family protein [Planctomycetes bacterium]|nr:CRTAC1 family protein [Planctomycetota bacterium]